jgi:hypothetical protein
MRWFYVTIALLLASACLVTWIYLRDRDTNWRPPGLQFGQITAIAQAGRSPWPHWLGQSG